MTKMTVVAIELTNKCNIKCVHCPTGKVDLQTGFLERDTLLLALRYADDYLELNWRGEALLHPDLVEFVGLVKERRPKLNVGFHTNAILLTQNIFKELVKNGLKWLHVSLHTAQSCLKFKEILKWNQKIDSSIYVYADVDNTQEELTAISCGLSRDMYLKDNIANWAGYLTKYRVICPDDEKRAKNCLFIKENKVIVAWDGSVNACCWDFKQYHKLGHIAEFDKIEHRAPYPLCKYCIWIQ